MTDTDDAIKEIRKLIADFAEAETNKDHNGYDCGNSIKLLECISSIITSQLQAALSKQREEIRTTILSCKPEKKDEKAKHLFITDNGTSVDMVNTPYIKGWNQGIDAAFAAIMEGLGDSK